MATDNILSSAAAPGAPLSISDTCEELASNCGLNPVVIPEEWSERLAIRPDVPLRVRSYAWSSPDIRQFRLTEITGALGTYMVNVGILPRPESMLPLMQLELLVVKLRLFLFIVDALPLHPVAWGLPTLAPHDYLSRLAATYPELPSTSERPEWSRSVISESAIWSRPNTMEAVTPAGAACQSFLEWCGDMIQAGAGQSVPAATAGDRRRFLRDFRTIFLENEPSRPYLGSMFGKDWAERYMSDFLFVDIDDIDSFEMLPSCDTQRIDRSPT